MRNVLLSLITATFVVFIGASNSSAACPPGYNSYWCYGSYPKPGGGLCIFKIHYCFKEDCLAGTIDVKIDWLEWTDPCGQTLTLDATFYSAVMIQATNDAYLYNSCIPACDPDHPSLYVFKVSRPACVRISNEIVSGPGGSSTILKLLDCEQEYCCDIYTVCLDYGFNPAQLKTTFVGHSTIGSGGECSSSYPTVPPLGKTWDDAWTTDCYHINCP